MFPEDRSAEDRSAPAALREALVCSLVGPLVHKLSNTLLAVSGLAELAARRPSAASNGDNLRLVTEESQHAVALLRCLAELARPAGDRPVPQDLTPRLRGLGDLLRPWLHERQLELELRLPPSLLGEWPERGVEQTLLLALCGPWLAQPGAAARRSGRRARLACRTRHGQLWLCLASSLPEAEPAPGDSPAPDRSGPERAGLERAGSALPRAPAGAPRPDDGSTMGPGGPAAARGFGRPASLPPCPIGSAAPRRRDLRLSSGSWRCLAWPLGLASPAGQHSAGLLPSTAPGSLGPSAPLTRPPATIPGPGARAPSPAPPPPRRARLLLVGGPDSELTAEVLAGEGHQVERAGSLAEARRSLARQIPEALLIEDFAGAPGFEWLRFSGEAQAIHGTRVGQLGAGVGLPAPRLPAPLRPAELLAFVQRLLAPPPASADPSGPPSWHPFDPAPPAG